MLLKVFVSFELGQGMGAEDFEGNRLDFVRFVCFFPGLENLVFL